MSMEIRPVDEWFHQTWRGHIELRCPVSGEPADPDQPPSFLFENAELAEGFMRGAGGELSPVTVGVWIDTGEDTAEALDVPADAVEEAVVLEAFEIDPGTLSLDAIASRVYAVGYMYRGLDADWERQRIERAHRQWQSLGGDWEAQRLWRPEPAINPYVTRITDTVVRAEAAGFYSGVDQARPAEAYGPVEQALEAMNRARDLADGLGFDRGQIAAMDTVLSNCRQWYGVLRYAQTLKAHDIGGVNAAPKPVSAIVSADDIDVPRKLEAVGFGLVGTLFDQPATWYENIQQTAKAMSQGYIARGDLR